MSRSTLTSVCLRCGKTDDPPVQAELSTRLGFPTRLDLCSKCVGGVTGAVAILTEYALRQVWTCYCDHCGKEVVESQAAEPDDPMRDFGLYMLLPEHDRTSIDGFGPPSDFRVDLRLHSKCAEKMLPNMLAAGYRVVWKEGKSV